MILKMQKAPAPALLLITHLHSHYCPAIFHSPSSIMAAGLNALSRWAVPVGVVFALGQAAIYDVRGGTRAVIFDRLSGVQEKVVNEGTHFLIPWLQKSIIYDVRTKPRNISTTTGSKDLQMVSLTLRVLHRPEVQKLPKIYQVGQSINQSTVVRNNNSQILIIS
jgi:regulator of protease activity HflC (stomatin/prohibitin superfamily)